MYTWSHALSKSVVQGQATFLLVLPKGAGDCVLYKALHWIYKWVYCTGTKKRIMTTVMYQMFRNLELYFNRHKFQDVQLAEIGWDGLDETLLFKRDSFKWSRNMLNVLIK